MQRIIRTFSATVSSRVNSRMVGQFEHLVFVYGTLKRDQPNHKVMTNTVNGMSQFICTARTVNRYPLVIASQFNIPFLLGKQDTGHQINGEIYSVDESMLKFLDAFEGHPEYYTRLETPVIATSEGSLPNGIVSSTAATELRPWIYILERFRPEMLHHPMMDTYDSYGEHGLRYVESETTTSLDDVDDLVDFLTIQSGD